jgi:hypothetical protein
MKIIIDNAKFDFNIGCKVLKAKYDTCPTQFEDALGDMWNDIVPITFQEISKEIKNIESRRVAIGSLGIENFISQVNPKLVNKQTLKKTTTWINGKGVLETKKFKDTYELYLVANEDLYKGADATSWFSNQGVYFVKCKCTSTDREYYIWVDAESVRRTNRDNGTWIDKPLNAIQAIAWTIQTNIPEGGIEKIVRQGDCILIKPNTKNRITRGERHLTEEEYKTLLVAES